MNMFWNKKDEKRSLPDLPPVRTSFSMHDEDFDAMNEKHDLPAFPDSPIQKGFSQSAIKDAVTPMDDENYKTEEVEEESDSIQKSIPLPKISNNASQLSNSKPIRANDIFVKIEKYQSARKALSVAQDKMQEIDELLRKIRETRMREEQELASWEKEVTSAKTKIEEVSQNLFDRMI